MSRPTINWTDDGQEAFDRFVAAAADIHIERMAPNTWSIVVHTDGERYELHVSASASVDVLLEAEPDRRTSVAEQHLRLFRGSRAVEEERLRGLDPTQISETLGIPHSEVDRILADLAHWGGEKPVTPTVLIYRRWLGEITTADMMGALKAWPYTSHMSAPQPFDGSIPGSWDEIDQAARDGYLTEAEYDSLWDVAPDGERATELNAALDKIDEHSSRPQEEPW